MPLTLWQAVQAVALLLAAAAFAALVAELPPLQRGPWARSAAVVASPAPAQGGGAVQARLPAPPPLGLASDESLAVLG